MQYGPLIFYPPIQKRAGDYSGESRLSRIAFEGLDVLIWEINERVRRSH